MSSDIYAESTLSTNVIYSRKKQDDRIEWEQREVDIYESAGEITNSHAEFQSQEGGSRTLILPPVQKGSFRYATLGLTVLFLLMLAGIIILSTCYILVTLENQRLKAEVSDTTANMSQLQKEVKQLKDEIKVKSCPGGWTRFGCSCYFKSTEVKTWSESRRDCQSKGADLVIINSAEEQKFIHENMRGESWIGLRVDYNQTNRKNEWKWVDGSPLTKTFRGAGMSNHSFGYYAAYCDGKWTQSHDSLSKPWICER